ncbi:hypothetical protein [Mycolicibacter arupensis]|uniref:hypothetical protein n=1 Tax=Mycolicibacter arupensis TaxID=342002 RepID=UPI0023F2761C|nr:hypothetical protein [Mycolicibacter arupensis]
MSRTRAPAPISAAFITASANGASTASKIAALSTQSMPWAAQACCCSSFAMPRA